MKSNAFGTLFQITTWGESHGLAMGVTIDGCPPHLPITAEEINQELFYRTPGRSLGQKELPFISPRKESDKVEILSGVFQGKTTGTPISLLIQNSDPNSTPYEQIKEIIRPGHANFTYQKKYGIFDYRGNGRASARETVCRVAAGAIAKKILRSLDIHLVAYIDQIGSISSAIDSTCSMEHLQTKTRQSALFCPDEKGEQKMRELLHSTKKEGDSLGGIVACQSTPLPIGLGDPIYEKLDANLAKGMLSIPATKGFEIGSGFRAASMKGSDHNDLPLQDTCEQLTFATNFAGGVLGGISNGRPLFFRVAFKPPSTIARSQPTITFDGEKTDLPLPPNSRHDSCVAIRAVPIVEAMAALVLVDALLASQTTHLPFLEKSLSSEPPLS